MEDNIKIKLNIGDRLYPLTIQRSQEFYFREAAKVIENSQRDINIAFVNELSKIFNLIVLYSDIKKKNAFPNKSLRSVT